MHEDLFDVYRVTYDGNVKEDRICSGLTKFEADVRVKILNDCYVFNDNNCKTCGGKHLHFKPCYAAILPHEI